MNAADAPPRGTEAAATLPWSGLLAVDKPAGMTSHDVVEVVRRRLRAAGAGHLGTLDPGATGLLLIALGAATRCVPVWQGGEKTYEATLRFGVVTSTQDLEGEVLDQRPVDLDEARVRAASAAFVGDLQQVPPMVSALQIGGERLHRIARRGGTVERRPRPVHVSEWRWTGFALPEASFGVRCSGGTYVRTLAHDLGASLGCGAALQALRRLRSEPFGLERAVTPGVLDRMTPAAVLAEAGIPLDEALEVLPAITLDEAAMVQVGHGQRPALAPPPRAPLGAGPRSIVAREPGGRALALGELQPDPASSGRVLFCPRTVFPWAVRQGPG